MEIIDINILNKEEIKKLFKKYNIHELELFKIICKCIKEPYKEEIMEIIEEIDIDKKSKLTINDETHKPFNYSVLNILDKINILNNKEIFFIHKLVSDAASYITYNQQINNHYNNIEENIFLDYNVLIDNTDHTEYLSETILELDNYLNNEKELRNKKKKLTKN